MIVKNANFCFEKLKFNSETFLDLKIIKFFIFFFQYLKKKV